jgi:hypothetical protein
MSTSKNGEKHEWPYMARQSWMAAISERFPGAGSTCLFIPRVKTVRSGSGQIYRQARIALETVWPQTLLACISRDITDATPADATLLACDQGNFNVFLLPLVMTDQVAHEITGIGVVSRTNLGIYPLPHLVRNGDIQCGPNTHGDWQISARFAKQIKLVFLRCSLNKAPA